MPRIPSPLTAIEVKNLPLGKHCVGGVAGLYIYKKPDRAYFFLRYADVSGRHELTVGKYPATTLSDARKKATILRAQIESGENPILKRLNERAEKRARALQAAKTIKEATRKRSFEAIAMEWVADRATNNYWANDRKGESSTVNLLKRHVFPAIGKRDVEDITAEMIRDMLKPIWQSKPSTAKKAKSYTHKVFQWAIALRIRKDRENPAAWNGSPLEILMEPLQNNRKPRTNYAACAVEEIPRLFQEMCVFTSMSARACEFAILTCTRSQAVRMATWEQFDLENGIWTIPVENDKIKTHGRNRTIYLSTQAVALLKSLPRSRAQLYVFTSTQGSHFSDAALTMFLRGLHEQRLASDGIGWIDSRKTEREGKPCVITIHGTARASFRTWAKDDKNGNNRRFDQEAVELCLLHSKKDGYNGAYDRAELVKERRLIMQDWGDYCTSNIPK